MYALRLGSKRFVAASKVLQPHSARAPAALSLVSRRNNGHVYDKRNYIPEKDDYNVSPTARPWDHFTLRLNQNRHRRWGQYMLWFFTLYLFWGWFKFMVPRQALNKVEKWDYQAKYWRDGYWIREFPEGLVIKEWANGKVSVEPGQSSRDSLPVRILNKIFFVRDCKG
mmetsp:Transcript_25398/g.41399  ORF Transcript_25398/g.41399 Transcript_25398/m.41399 type:complete len:168 (-) Transcript_25398:281-784(-)|eukprot:CAMPEP_0202694356 /NCGR_PEP_ID=MMETSP1385-20130828/8232_1 /ASSEMBLY_ACC=CAM_ASM_000861 /TAXON_ID=933848 /ORGANISM="Elphidium margaritaceum" /LENGTH=167 /DNA_ID=CAMNT_0049350181 /DNA_START=47 /DNA_END=550 /DNA_ORIENTATION=+